MVQMKEVKFIFGPTLNKFSIDFYGQSDNIVSFPFIKEEPTKQEQSYVKLQGLRQFTNEEL